MKLSGLLFAATLSMVLVANAIAQETSEVMIDATFDQSIAENLEVHVIDADVNIQSGPVENIRVTVTVAGEDPALNRKYFDKQDYTVRLDNGTVRVISQRELRTQNRPERQASPLIDVQVHIPESFTVSIRSIDGDVAINRLAGDLHIKSQDGKITVGAVDGDEVELRTSDGDITAENVSGNSIHVGTVDGDIELGTVHAKRLVLRTSDGNISLESAMGSSQVTTVDGNIAIGVLRTDHATVRTSDGDIHLTEVEGSVSAQSVDGEIMLGSIKGDQAQLNTSDGEITVKSVEVQSISAKTVDGDIALGEVSAKRFAINATDGDVSIKSLAGTGQATTQDGDVTIDWLQSAGRSTIRTSAGNISVIQKEGSIAASSTDGSIDLELTGSISVNATTSNGDIVITLPADHASDLMLTGESIDIEPELGFSGEIELSPNQASGKINGGGKAVRAQITGDGRILVRAAK